MRLRTRFLIIGVGIALFLVASPVLILFARGYKIDFQKRQLVKTGSLVVKSEPGKANILMDGKKLRATTPETVRFLVPKDYNVTVQKAGYQPWTKRLSVQSELVTWANLDRDFITLFLENPKSSKAYGILAAYQSAENNAVVFADDKSLSMIGSDNKISALHNYDFYRVIKDLQLPEASFFSLLSVDRSLILTPEKWKQVVRAEADASFTVIQTQASVEIYNSRSELLLDYPLAQAFRLDGNNLWLVVDGNFMQVDLRNAQESVIAPGVNGTDFKILRGDDNTFLISDKNLYIKNDKLDQIYGNAGYAYWSAEGHYLVYGNDHEIFIFDPGDGRSTLLLRSSTVLNSASVNRRDGYVFFMNEGKIKAIEIDGRDHRNIYTITDEGRNFFVTDDGKFMVVSGTTKLESLEIR